MYEGMEWGIKHKNDHNEEVKGNSKFNYDKTYFLLFVAISMILNVSTLTSKLCCSIIILIPNAELSCYHLPLLPLLPPQVDCCCLFFIFTAVANMWNFLAAHVRLLNNIAAAAPWYQIAVLLLFCHNIAKKWIVAFLWQLLSPLATLHFPVANTIALSPCHCCQLIVANHHCLIVDFWTISSSCNLFALWPLLSPCL